MMMIMTDVVVLVDVSLWFVATIVNINTIIKLLKVITNNIDNDILIHNGNELNETLILFL